MLISLSYLFCFLLATVQAIHLPPSIVQSLRLSAANLTAINRDGYCNAHAYGIGLSGSDCRAAIAEFPKDTAWDVLWDQREGRYVYPAFTRTTEISRHRLPQTFESHSCVVRVRLAQGREFDYTSWRILGLRAGNVVKKCVELRNGRGGIVTTGDTSGIEITVAASTPADESVASSQ